MLKKLFTKIKPYLKSFLLLYFVLGGFIFYSFSASIDAVSIFTLEMSEGWCIKWSRMETSRGELEECTEFKDDIEKEKYFHNQLMHKKHKKKLFALFVVASLASYSLMLLKPLWFFDDKDFKKFKVDVIAAALFYGFIIGFVIPYICSVLLPPPIEWFPDEFIAIHQDRINQKLLEIHTKYSLK